MTWSIVARDPETGYFGIAVATRFFAVGALCPWTEAKVGAISTQALVNPSLGPHGLALLREGYPAPAALDVLMRGDPGQATRQVHLIDAQGRSAADCLPRLSLVELRRLYGVAPQHSAGAPGGTTRP